MNNLPPPDRFNFADASGQASYLAIIARIQAKPPVLPVISIQGPMASGKTHLARHILDQGFKTGDSPIVHSLPPFDHHLYEERDSFLRTMLKQYGTTGYLYLDDVSATTRGEGGRGKSRRSHITSQAIIEASDAGILILLVGESFDLSDEIRQRTLFITLA